MQGLGVAYRNVGPGAVRSCGLCRPGRASGPRSSHGAKAALVLVVVDEFVLPDDGLLKNLAHPDLAVLLVLQLRLGLPVAAGLAETLGLLLGP